MLTSIKTWLTVPDFEDEDKLRRARLLLIMLMTLFAGTLIGTTALTLLAPEDLAYNLPVSFFVLPMVVGLWQMVRRGLVRYASMLLSFALWLMITLTAWISYNGTRDPTLSLYFLVITAAGLLLGGRAVIIFGVVSLLGVVVIFAAEAGGIKEFPYPPQAGPVELISLILALGLTALLVYFAMGSINEGFERARHSERAQMRDNLELQAIKQSLEERVTERTSELERRSNYLEASAEVSRTVASILDVSELAQQVVELIRDRFDLYYVGLFRVDESEEWAVLHAGTGEAGRAMLARGHRLRIGDGMIGWSVAHSKPRIALEAAEDEVRKVTAELPETRSEAALPLRSRGRVLGALTVQDVKSGAFDQDVIVVLQTMADQVAVALDNADLFSESQAALESTRRAYGELSRQAWVQMLRARPDLAFRSDDHETRRVVTSKTARTWRSELERAVQQGKTVLDDGAGGQSKHSLAVPIKVAGEVIGVLDTHKSPDSGGWTEGQVTLLEEITHQLGLALESARLHETTQTRAAHDRLVAEISGRMRETLDVETVLKTAVDDVYEVLGLDEATIYLAPEAAETHSL